jgi:hypothetical protein
MPRRENALLALAVALTLGWIALACFRPTGTEDLWWTLRVGDSILGERAVPRTLTWTHEALADLPYVCHAWLATVAYSAVKAAFGLGAVPALPALIACATFGCLLWMARRLGAPWLLALAVSDLALYVVLPRMMCRAEVFGYLFFALALVAVAGYVRTRRVAEIAWLAPLALLWANTHGSFLLLLGLLPLVALGLALDAWRAAGHRLDAWLPSLFSRESGLLFGVFLLALGASLVNPYGAELIRSAIAQSTSNVWRLSIEEWRPLWADGSLPPHFVAPAALAALAIATGWRRLSFVSMLLAVALAALALRSNRHLALFGIGAAFLLADSARGVELGRVARAALAGGLVAALVSANATNARPFGLAERSLARNPSQWMTPQGLDFVRANVRGNVLNRWHLGGLLIYFAWPQVRVCIDSRADPYPFAYFRSFQRALYGSARDTLDFVDAYAIDHIIVDRRLYEAEFRRKLRGLRGFRLVYADSRSVVLSRTLPAPGGAAPR